MSAILQLLGNKVPEPKLQYFEKVRQERRAMVIPLKINFLSSGRMAHVCTLDVSPSGARIHSAGHDFRAGDIVLVQWRVERTHARVVWVGEDFRKRHQVGLECLELDKVFWKEEKLTKRQLSQR